MSNQWPLLGQDPDSLGNTGLPVPQLVAAEDLDLTVAGPALDAASRFDTDTVAVRKLSSTAAKCPACGGLVDSDGYCQTCGVKAPSLRDHFELTPGPNVAGVCDRGISHPRNEDALAAYADDTRAVLVICDGVSTSSGSDVAAMVGAEKACQYLATAPATVQSLQEAVRLANQAVIESTDADSPNAAAATLAAALLVGDQLTFANVGDSRIYWIGSSDARQLSTDDSLAADMIAKGVARSVAESAAGAHAITSWLGPDCADQAPNLGQAVLEPGWLLICSDGLWNYASEAEALGSLVRIGESTLESPLDLARRLVNWANGQGGHDNVSVAVAKLAN
ncbi:MAG: serine/threonine-protein phosphatase [Propionibacteriaceae bacterium]|jgi:serine/threonine protein phosphatase PrpC|nr:serine/threonine-protein phosphatase [Propionibacteriaceae bacterium]